MGKAKRKPRPSMPDWYWWEQDGCWFCKNRNNCNQCKANRRASKENHKSKRKRDKIAENRFYDLDGVKFVDVLRIIAEFICLVLMIVYAYLAFKAKEKDDLIGMVWNLSFMIFMSSCIR